MITYDLMMTMILIGFQKDFLPFSEDVFLIFFHVGKSKANERRNVERTRLLIRFIDETGKNEIVLFWKVRLSIYFSENFSLFRVWFFSKMIHTIWKWRKQTNQTIQKAKFPTFVIPWKVFSTANTIRRPIFAIYTFRHFGLHVLLVLVQGL